MRNFKFLTKNLSDVERYGENYVPIPYQHNNYELQYQIEDLQSHNQRLTSQLIEANERVQRLASRAYPDIQRVRDEQRIDRNVYQHITNPETYYQYIRQEQVLRLAQKLLEENLIEHTLRVEEPNGDYLSRMEIKVQNIL